MATPIALLDACVLYPQTLRDLLLNLARTDLFRARWTHLINEERTRNLLEKNPGKADRVARTLALVNQSVEDCLISLDNAAVCAAIRRMRERYRNPPMTAEEYVESLEKKGLSTSADLLRALSDQI